MSRDYTVAPIEVRHARLISLVDDISNEIRFAVGAEEAQEAVLDMLDEQRAIVRSLQAGPGELTLEAG